MAEKTKIAIPWQEVIGDKMEMLNRIAEAIGGHILFETCYPWLGKKFNLRIAPNGWCYEQ